MSVKELMTWTYDTVTSGVTGNAAYDGIKYLMGATFALYQNYAKQGKADDFQMLFEAELAKNKELQQQLEELKDGKQPNYQSISGSITTGNISNTGGDVQVGHSINQ